MSPYLVRIGWVSEGDTPGNITMNSVDWEHWEEPVHVPDGPTHVYVSVIDNLNGVFYFHNGYPVADVPIAVGPQRLIYAWMGKVYSL
jgi:hypothetical protein